MKNVQKNYTFILSYLNYKNAAWTNTTTATLTILLPESRVASRRFLSLLKNRNAHVKPLLTAFYKMLFFMHKVKNNNITHIFK